MTSVYNVSSQNDENIGDETGENTEINPTRFLSLTYNENENISNRNEVKNICCTNVENGTREKGFTNKLQKRNHRLVTFKTSVQSYNRKERKSKYQSHVDSSHFCCTFCDKYFFQKHLLRRHMKLHVGIAVDKSKETRDKLPEEIICVKTNEVRDEKVSHNCETCDTECKCESSYKEEEDKPLSCHICGKEFKFNSSLAHHIEVHESKVVDKKSLLCHVCGKRYTKSGSLAKHELQHEGKGTFRCRPCGEVFATEADRMKHRDERHEKPWKCHICNHMFATQEKLDSHIRWHENKVTEVFICNVCGKEFKLKVNLKVHVESRCGTDPQHVCNVCGKAFMTRGTLVTHALLHTGEKTFLCRFCGKSFRLKVEMQRHERSHTGEKPFVCKVCNKAFAHRESLVTHNTLHTGIRPYMCEACGSTFSCIGNLIKHRKTHRNRCALVTSSIAANKSKLKSSFSQLGINDKSTVAVETVKTAIEDKRLVGNNIAQDINTTPALPGTCCSYRTSNYEGNNEWISPVFGNNEQITDQFPATVEKYNTIADFHLDNMERTFKRYDF